MALPCGRCALRLASGSTYEGFMAAREVRSRPDCPACLGLLDHESYIDKVVAEVKAGQYEFEDYRLTVAVPASLFLRQHWLQSQAKATLCADVKDVLKWGLSYDLARRLDKPFSPASPFLIQLSFLSPQADQDLYQFKSLIPGLIINERKTKKNTPDEFSLRAMQESLKHTPDAWTSALSHYEPQTCPVDLQVALSMQPVFLAGSYMKYSRRLSQSPWLIEGEDKPMSSVQEILGEPLKAAFACESYTLHGSVSCT